MTKKIKSIKKEAIQQPISQEFWFWGVHDKGWFSAASMYKTKEEALTYGYSKGARLFSITLHARDFKDSNQI